MYPAGNGEPPGRPGVPPLDHTASSVARCIRLAREGQSEALGQLLSAYRNYLKGRQVRGVEAFGGANQRVRRSRPPGSCARTLEKGRRTRRTRVEPRVTVRVGGTSARGFIGCNRLASD